MPVRALVVSDAIGDFLPWAGPDLLVHVVHDPLRVPFEMLSRPVDIVVTAAPLPEEIGPLGVPVMQMDSLPEDPRSAWEVIRRTATQAAEADPRALLTGALRRLQSDVERARADVSSLERRMSELLPPLVAATLGRTVRMAEPIAQTAAALEAPDRPIAPPPPPVPMQAAVPALAAYPKVASQLPSSVTPPRAVSPDPLPVTLVIGPVVSLPQIEGLVDDIEYAPGLRVQFRVFREGHYQVDGQIMSRRGLIEWLSSRADVESVEEDGAIIRVLPRRL